MSEYQIISRGSYKALAASVNEAIKKGWQPQGGVFALILALGSISFYQAMTRGMEKDK
jgi:Domain of unknown function (DUF1737)